MKYFFFLIWYTLLKNKVTDTLSEPTTGQIPRCINNLEQMRYVLGGKIAARSLLGLIDVVRYQDKLNDGTRVNGLVIKYEYDSVSPSVVTFIVPSTQYIIMPILDLSFICYSSSRIYKIISGSKTVISYYYSYIDVNQAHALQRKNSFVINYLCKWHYFLGSQLIFGFIYLC